jgi:hypothetical protein
MDGAAIAEMITKDAVTCMLSGEIQSDDQNGLAQYIVDRLSAEYPDVALPQGLDPFSLLTGAILGRSIATYAQVLEEEY